MLRLLLYILLCSGCSFTDTRSAPPEPYFKPGEYGGEPLPGTESLHNIQISPDGQRVALIRDRTPDNPSDPRYQLWILNRDGSDPRLISVNTGGVDWSPDGKRLAVTVMYGIDFYAYTIDLETNEVRQWTGQQGTYFDKPVASNPRWFQDGRRLLVSVFAKAFEQQFERGIYVIDTETSEITGPLLDFFQGAFIGNRDRHIVGTKYVIPPDEFDGNIAIYSLEDQRWSWLTHIPRESVRHTVSGAVISPISETVAYSLRTENAPQIFLTNVLGSEVRQVTRAGGDNIRWTPDGTGFTFIRDMHRGMGARYVPFYYDLAAGTEAPLWPTLPDLLPAFPSLASQATHAGLRSLSTNLSGEAP